MKMTIKQFEHLNTRNERYPSKGQLDRLDVNDIDVPHLESFRKKILEHVDHPNTEIALSAQKLVFKIEKRVDQIIGLNTRQAKAANEAYYKMAA